MFRTVLVGAWENPPKDRHKRNKSVNNLIVDPFLIPWYAEPICHDMEID